MWDISTNEPTRALIFCCHQPAGEAPDNDLRVNSELGR